MTHSTAPSTVAATMAWQWKCRVDAVCERFEDAWAADASPRVEDYLDDPEVPVARRAALLAELLKLERELRQKRGDKPGASEYLARFPGHAMVVRSVFGEDRVGEYDLLAPIGEGGMGVVYHARHRKMGREVALKMIRPYCLDDSSAVDRFRLEAQLAARLDHEHIVTVYEAGQADGQHFYAMRYIVGQSLAELIAKAPMDADRAARYLEQVARAVDFAHTHDVLHRDLKPRNILIDAADRAFVTDFGLAKVLNMGTGATRSDDRLGTPPYMSPEQVRDPSRAGVASDVYSLGATLYEALTGRPPFQAENPLEIYRQVLDDDPTPPRTRNPRCPRDIETICLKCLHKDPARRYASALEVAEDLRRYQERLPIKGRRVGPVERVARWSGKHPTAALLIAVSFLAMIAVAGIVQTRRRNAISDQNYRQARAVIDEIPQFADSRLGDYPVLRSELLQIALRYYEAFLNQRGDDPELAYDTAATFTRVATLSNSLNDRAAALKAHQKAVALRRKFAAKDSGDRAMRAALADDLHDMGILYNDIGDPSAAIAAYREALAIREALVEEDPVLRSYVSNPTAGDLPPKDRVLVGDLARSHGYIGDWEREQGFRDEAKASYRRAEELRERLVATNESDLLAKFQLARSYGNAGYLAREDGHPADAMASHRQALALQEELVRPGPEAVKARLDAMVKATGRPNRIDYDDFRADLAASHNAIGVLLSEEGLRSDAAAEFRLAAGMYDALATDHPGLPRWDADRGWTATYLGEATRSPEDLERGRTLLEGLLRADPSVSNVRAGLARNRYASALIAEREGKLDEARRLLALAQEDQARLAAEHGKNFDFRRDLEQTRAALTRLGPG